MSGAGAPASAWPTAVIGAVAGLAWAAALRAFMAEVNTVDEGVHWLGTFVGILLPGMLAGAALGASARISPDSRGGRRALRWCAAAVWLLAVLPMLLPGQLQALLTTGMGGGAVGVALVGMLGGYALGGARAWLRAIGGVIAAALTVGVCAAVPLIGGPTLAITTPRGAWIVLLTASLMVLLMVAAAIPFRRLGARSATSGTGPEA